MTGYVFAKLPLVINQSIENTVQVKKEKQNNQVSSLGLYFRRIRVELTEKKRFCISLEKSNLQNQTSDSINKIVNRYI